MAWILWAGLGNRTVHWLSWGSVQDIHICSGDYWASYTQYFCTPSYPVSIPWKKRWMQHWQPYGLCAQLYWAEAWLPGRTSIALTLIWYQGDLHSPGSAPTSWSPLLPILLLPPPSSLPPILLKTMELTTHLLPALLTQHSFPMHVFHPDWNLLDAKPISFLAFVSLSSTIRHYSCLFPCIIAAINVNNNSMHKLLMINCLWGEIISSLGYTPPITSL